MCSPTPFTSPKSPKESLPSLLVKMVCRVTTQIFEATLIAACFAGISYYPTRTSEELDSIRAQIAGWNGNPSDFACATMHAGVGLFEWSSVQGYLDCLDRNSIAVNVAVLVPQVSTSLNLNSHLLTPSLTGESTSARRGSERHHRERGSARRPSCALESRDAGGSHRNVIRIDLHSWVSTLKVLFQRSSNSQSHLRMYASYAELAHLCKALATSFPGAVFAPHHRSYGKNAMEAYKEMLDLARETGVPLHLTHCKLATNENVGKAGALLAMIDAAIDDGVDVTLDTYPYTPGSTTLASLLPAWANQGGPKETLKRLTDSELRNRIRHEMEDGCGQSNRKLYDKPRII